MMEMFVSRLAVPEAALEALDKLYTQEDMLLVTSLEKEVFTHSEAKKVLEAAAGGILTDGEVQGLLRSAYRRGVVRLEDDSFTRFKLSTFFEMLGVLVMSEPERYLALPRETQVALDGLYFSNYVKGVQDLEVPTQDRVLTLEETLEFVDTFDTQLWLNNCDCRTLAGNCGKPVNVCISVKNGINTMPHRGWSKAITPEEAKSIVRYADGLGLVHTANPKGICNCCKDCCYLLRAQTVKNSNLIWPGADKIAAFDDSTCIDCGLCTERCQFEAFARVDGNIAYDSKLCRGCGLCADTCPTSAISMAGRSSQWA